jgi:spermidine synthase
MPVLTSPRSVILIAGINAVTGLILLTEAKSLRPQLLRFGRAVAVASAVGAVVLMVVPNRFATDPSLNMLHRSKATVLAQAEDDIAAVQASNTGGSLQLYVDGYTMTALTDDTRMMAHLPQMIRPNAKSMCVIAFGMGSSYRSSMIEGLKTDAVELVPSVPGMFPYFYPDASQYLDDPNGQILIADGRNHVDLTTSKYDLLIVDPPPPMNSSGTAVLFSQEFYQSASARLNSGGVMMEWEYDGQSVDEFRSHVKTFSSVFKHVTLVFGAAQNTVGVMMVGSNDPIVLDPANIEGVLAKPGVLADLNSAPDSPTAVKTAAQWEAYILGNVWISDSKAAQFGASGTLITDDRPYTEYDLLRHLFGPSSPPAIKANLLALMPRAGG